MKVKIKLKQLMKLPSYWVTITQDDMMGDEVSFGIDRKFFFSNEEGVKTLEIVNHSAYLDVTSMNMLLEMVEFLTIGKVSYTIQFKDYDDIY